MYLKMSSGRWRPSCIGRNMLIHIWRHNAIWEHRSGSRFAQAMSCCLMVPSHYLHQFWLNHDDVIKWKHFPRNWSLVRGIHRSPVNSLHKGQWCGALMFSLICTGINGRVNNREAGDLRHHCAHYDVIVMIKGIIWHSLKTNFRRSVYDNNL